jgi:hypothetical protein
MSMIFWQHFKMQLQHGIQKCIVLLLCCQLTTKTRRLRRPRRQVMVAWLRNGRLQEDPSRRGSSSLDLFRGRHRIYVATMNSIVILALRE